MECDQLTSKVKNGGNVGAELHEEAGEVEEGGQLSGSDVVTGDGEEICEFSVDFFRELILIFYFLLALLLLGSLVSMNHLAIPIL